MSFAFAELHEQFLSRLGTVEVALLRANVPGTSGLANEAEAAHYDLSHNFRGLEGNAELTRRHHRVSNALCELGRHCRVPGLPDRTSEAVAELRAIAAKVAGEQAKKITDRDQREDERRQLETNTAARDRSTSARRFRDRLWGQFRAVVDAWSADRQSGPPIQPEPGVARLFEQSQHQPFETGRDGAWLLDRRRALPPAQTAGNEGDILDGRVDETVRSAHPLHDGASRELYAEALTQARRSGLDGAVALVRDIWEAWQAFLCEMGEADPPEPNDYFDVEGSGARRFLDAAAALGAELTAIEAGDSEHSAGGRPAGARLNERFDAQDVGLAAFRRRGDELQAEYRRIESTPGLWPYSRSTPEQWVDGIAAFACAAESLDLAAAWGPDWAGDAPGQALPPVEPQAVATAVVGHILGGRRGEALQIAEAASRDREFWVKVREHVLNKTEAIRRVLAERHLGEAVRLCPPPPPWGDILGHYNRVLDAHGYLGTRVSEAYGLATDPPKDWTSERVRAYRARLKDAGWRFPAHLEERWQAAPESEPAGRDRLERQVRQGGARVSRGVPADEANILVRGWLKQHGEKDPDSVKIRTVAKETGVSVGGVNGTPAWTAFEEARKKRSNPATRTIPLSEGIARVMNDDTEQDPALTAELNDQVEAIWNDILRRADSSEERHRLAQMTDDQRRQLIGLYQQQICDGASDG